ncbi:hypothetical protein [Paraflavitalea sp. CAU 1676]|uniref:hypothetical protein n=1 Tax=Paraflavitalea sp. CAU 1676 TaxID=3032598 RepID=UPI0023DA087B|nr:hypothetical protein [Paraflavitalea sp. CAU 1676]MDF2189215.1 hypothetical protein [Paraflavitalea sp. CAU 1676]
MTQPPFQLSQLKPFLPYLYFSGLPLVCFIDAINKTTEPGNLLLLIPAIPFVLQLFFSIRHVDMILGVITFAIAIYLTLAYASDLSKITAVTPRAISFISLGGVIVVLNYIMSVRLFINESLRNKASASHQYP